jgi:hypothetical protein
MTADLFEIIGSAGRIRTYDHPINRKKMPKVQKRSGKIRRA